MHDSIYIFISLIYFVLVLKVSGQYELDYSDRGRAGLSIQRSVKNFQLKMEVS